MGHGTYPLSFTNFVRLMIPDPTNQNEKLIKGCQILMPETVFINQGKIDFIAKNDPDVCLVFDSK